MDGTPHLLTDVKFSERRRGYDPEEVDNFLERVSTAVAQLQDKLREVTARAEEADARVADAQRAQATAEAELARVGSEQPSSAPAPATPADPEADAEKASRILLMAQKTADATIDDANTTAQNTVSEARTTAAGLVAEAEAEAERTRTEAEVEADALVQERRESIEREVRELEELKVTVQSDIDILGTHLDEQRARIRRGVEALALVLDDPDGLRVDTPPEVHDTSRLEAREPTEQATLVDDSAADTADATDTTDAMDTSDATDTTAEDSVSNAPEAALADDAVGEQEIVVLTEGIDVSGVDLTAAPEPARSPGGIFGANSQSSFEAKLEESAAPHLAAVPDDRPDIDLAEEELFAHVDRDDRSGPPTQQFTPFGESEDPLGPPDDEADKAMRAFFETDFDESDPQQQKSRFGFRR
jgi:DivIVA domain-containing protein